MKRVGITGGIGAGKSLVCRIFQILGIPNYPADQRAKWLQSNNIDLKKEITALLGKHAYDENGILNNVYVGNIVFNNPEKLAALNSIVHPAVAADFEIWCQNHADKPFILKEAALLFETGSYKSLDANLLVHAKEQTRITRVLKRDPKRTTEGIKKIMQQQMAEDKKLALATHILYNDESASLIKQCVDLYHTLSSTEQ